MAGLKQLIQFIWEGRGGWSSLPRGSEMAAALGFSTAAGISVTPDSALQLSAVSSAVRLIAESIASLPLHVYERRGNKRSIVTDGPHHDLLRVGPNEIMTPFSLFETLGLHLLTGGNGYALIIWSQAGDPIQLLPLDCAVLSLIHI